MDVRRTARRSKIPKKVRSLCLLGRLYRGHEAAQRGSPPPAEGPSRAPGECPARVKKTRSAAAERRPPTPRSRSRTPYGSEAAQPPGRIDAGGVDPAAVNHPPLERE